MMMVVKRQGGARLWNRNLISELTPGTLSSLIKPNGLYFGVPIAVAFVQVQNHKAGLLQANYRTSERFSRYIHR